MNKKKFRSFLGLFAVSMLSTLVGCSSEDKIESGVGKVAVKLSAAGPGGSTFCMMGDIVLTKVGTGEVVTLVNNTCTPSAISVEATPGDYTVTVPSPSCSVLNDPPTDPAFTGVCSVTAITPNPVTITLGQTSNVAIAVTFESQQADDVTVVFGVGAAQFTIVPTNHVTDSCGGALSGQICQDGVSMCLALDSAAAAPHCYRLCDFVENNSAQDNCPSVTDSCIPVARPASSGAAGGPPSDRVGDKIVSLDNTQGVCIPAIPAVGGTGGQGGMGGAGGAGAGGVGGLGGLGGIGGAL